MLRQNDNFLNALFSDNETEMLQTDIQRFLAILAFCLLPIFMLVQSIPVVSHEKDAVISQLTLRIEEQNRELDRLKKDNKMLRVDVSRLLKKATAGDRLQFELMKAMERIESQRQEIETALQERIDGTNDLGKLKKRLEERNRIIKQFILENRQLHQLVEQAAKDTNDAVEVKRDPDWEDTAQPEEKGLYVAFASDRIFLDLLESGEIQLFIHMAEAKKTFRAIRTGSRIDFTSDSPANGVDLWEIKEIMVPREILDGFRQWSTLSSRNRMFVVGLSETLSRQIREKDIQAGRIIIGGNGSITIQAHGK